MTAGTSPQQSELYSIYLQHPLTVLLNILPIVLFTVFLFFLSNRTWFAILISGTATMVMTLVNYFKLSLRGDPFLAADIRYLSEAVHITTGYNLTITDRMKEAAAVILLITLLSALFIKQRFRPEKYVQRAIFAIITLAAFAALVPTVYFSNRIYAKTAFLDDSFEYMNMWSDTDQYVSRGFLYPFINSAKTNFDKKPEGYSKASAEEMLSQYEHSDIPEGKKVSVIAVMLEAYSDFSKFEEIEFTGDPYPYFHRLQKEGVSGSLVTNAYAGDTIDTERCFITGYSRHFEYRADTQSYAHYFREQGYTVEGAHPGYGWFYNRQNVNEYLGFEKYYFIENRYTKSEYLYNDAGFFADIVKLFGENKKTGKPYFNFSVTYNNHGPYRSDGLTGREFAAKNELSNESYAILNNYLNGISGTDKAIEQLVEYFRKEKEPAVLVFFGDHNPWMGDDSFVFDELGVSMDRGTEEGFLNYYSTPYVIWANDAAKKATGNEFKGSGGSFSPMFLMNRIFELCSWEGNRFMKASDELFDRLDVVHEDGPVREDGVLTDKPSVPASDALKKFEIIQYFWRREGLRWPIQ